MANTKISELAAAAALTGAEQVPVVQSADTKRTTLSAILALLVDAAPGTLDTLNELAAALGDDANFAATMTAALAGKSATGHGHAEADVTSLVADLASKIQGIGTSKLTVADTAPSSPALNDLWLATT